MLRVLNRGLAGKRGLVGACRLQSSVSYKKEGDVGIITMDDGKMNSFSFSHMDGLSAALDQAADDGAVVLTGNAKCFSAGFDLKVMMGEDKDEAARMIAQGGEFVRRIFSFPRPVVAAATGHALAAGAIVLLASDVRIAGSNAKAKFGLNEVAIGLAMPVYGMELARARLDPRHLSRALCQAAVVGAEEAQAIGYLDEVVEAQDPDAVVEHAVSRAQQLAETLQSPAFALTKMKERQMYVDAIEQTWDAEMAFYADRNNWPS